VSRIGAIAASLLLAAAASLPADEREALSVDATASRVVIHLGRTGLLKFLGHDHEIAAPIAGGQVEVVEGDPARSSVRLRFEARRLAIVAGSEPAGDVPKVEERMRGEEVLDVARYPEIVFASSSVAGEAIGPGRCRLRVRGALEVKGRSFPVEIPLEVRRAGDTLEATGEVGLRLRELGIEPPSVGGVVNVADPFRLSFDIVAHRTGTAVPAP